MSNLKKSKSSRTPRSKRNETTRSSLNHLHAPDGYGILDRPSRLNAEDAAFIRSQGFRVLSPTKPREVTWSRAVLEARLAPPAGVTKRQAVMSVKELMGFGIQELSKKGSVRDVSPLGFRFGPIMSSIQRDRSTTGQVAAMVGITKSQVNSSLKDLGRLIFEELKKENALRLVGLGLFHYRRKKSRTLHVPSNVIPRKTLYHIYFTPDDLLKSQARNR